MDRTSTSVCAIDMDSSFATPASRRGSQRRFSLAAAALTLVALGADAASVDTSRLPPPVADSVEFLRDVKPILDAHCLKCHGAERPKGGFSLVSRDAVISGGNQGPAVAVGNSEQSPLIHYVARLVDGMEMPPDTKGRPLTPEEIGVLRAWIDQGLVWEGGEPPEFYASATSTLGYTWVRGDQEKFRELFWQREGWNGGLSEFELTERPTHDSRFSSSGHLLRDDYRVQVEAAKNDLGFTRFGWQQYRRYYDSSGGYYPGFDPALFELSPELSMDHGRAWAETGLTLPGLPRFVLGYEYRYRDGNQSTLQWGPVTQGGETRNIFPAYKAVSEDVHILKLDVDYALGKWLVADHFRAEWYDLDTLRVNDAGYTVGTGEMAITRGREEQDWFQGANTLRVESQLNESWFAAAGYLYSYLDSAAAVEVDTSNPAALGPSIAAPGWLSDPISLNRESHVFSLNTALVPWKPVTFTLGLQNEWTRQEGFGSSLVNLAVPFDPFLIDLDPSRFRSDLDRALFTESAGLRFTAIPYTTLFAETRFEQENAGLYERNDGGLNPFLRDTDTEGRGVDYRFGFHTSPWRRVSLSAHYRGNDRETDYDTTRKEAFGDPYEGYPGFIRWRDLWVQEVQTKLALQVTGWLKATLAYQWRYQEYETATDPVTDFVSNTPGGISPGGSLVAGTYRAQIPSLNLTLTPWQRLYFSGTLAYQDARTRTATQGSDAVAPYAGDIYTFFGSATLRVGERTDLTAGYSYSRADFAQEEPVEGLPLGIEYAQHGGVVGVRHRLDPRKAVGLQYRFYHYDEPSSQGFNDFTAHAVFATFTLRFQ